jgi:hypothetical protein
MPPLTRYGNGTETTLSSGAIRALRPSLSTGVGVLALVQTKRASLRLQKLNDSMFATVFWFLAPK